MEFSILLIVVITLAFAAFIGSKGIDLERAKLQAKNGPDNSLGKSELKALIQDAVRDANAPLEARIRELESALEHQPSLPAAEVPHRLLSADTGLEQRAT